MDIDVAAETDTDTDVDERESDEPLEEYISISDPDSDSIPSPSSATYSALYVGRCPSFSSSGDLTLAVLDRNMVKTNNELAECNHNFGASWKFVIF